MHTVYQRWLVLLAFLLTAGASPAQTINTDAVTAYWKMTDALRRDEPLTDATWQQFLALPDNRVYADAVWGDDTASLARYRRAIEVVYQPRYESVRQAAIKAGKWYYVLVNRYKEQEEQDRAFLKTVAKNPVYLEKMYAYAYEFLPVRNRQKVANLHLAYVALGNDATSQLAGIVFSIRSARESNSIKSGILEAHEMHHRLRITQDWNMSSTDEPLLTGFYYALNEGLADLIDKRIELEQKSDTSLAGYTRRWLLAPAPAVIYKIDSTIQVLASGGPVTSLKFYRRLTNGTNGHLPGFYMAYAILKSGYKKQLLAHADDPIAFALLYQKAARKNPAYPQFSLVSERYMRQLARKYAKL